MTKPHVQRTCYKPYLDTQKLSEIALHGKVHIARVYYLLMSGHTVTDTYLKLIGRRDSEQCWECNLPARMDIDNMLFRCLA